MAAKTETPPPVKDAAVASSAPSPASGGMRAWLPVIVALLGAPAATWATVEFFLLPRLQQRVGGAPAAGSAPAAAGRAATAPGKGARKGDIGKTDTYEFQNIVVNLAGTMGTRYLKTSFIVTAAAGADVRDAFEGAKPRLTDVTLNVLSSLSLADLEEPGAKNIVREKLVSSYNQALGRKVAEQVYFSDFVIQ